MENYTLANDISFRINWSETIEFLKSLFVDGR